MAHKKSPPQTEPQRKSEKPSAFAWLAAQTPTQSDIRLKVVPGSRKTEIAGTYGDRLKIKVSAPPEDGKANAAVCDLLARTLGISPRDVTIIAGATSPEKLVRISCPCDLGKLA